MTNICRHWVASKLAARRTVWMLLMTGLMCLLANPALAQPAEDSGPQPVPPAVPTPAASSSTPGAAPAGAEPLINASKVPTNLTEAVLALGWWSIPFSIATLIAMWFTVERMVVLRRARVIPRPFVERILKQLHDGTLSQAEALELCHANGSPVASIFAHGLRKWGKPSVEVEQAIIDGGERQVSQLRTHLRVLNGVATICPLIGLLGTVWGMIEAFNGLAVRDANGGTELLAGGIATALLTTAAGLLIAIPSLIAYLHLTGRVDKLVMEMDDLAQLVVHSISGESMSGVAPSRLTTRKSAKA